ncbi:acyltransferase [Candidatus Pelagibacter sp.]|nr:acyltransferase [Candidatus Pelagibacter sp.]
MIENLQSLRAFAAINVVIFHILGSSISYGFNLHFLSTLGGWGANGVDIFFVISGFVMLHTQLKKKRNIYDFLKSRVIRIVPIYWFVTTFSILTYILLPNSIFNSAVPSTEHMLHSYFFVSSFLSEQSPIIFIGWTLEWEMLFYLVFGLGLLFTDLRKTSMFVFCILFIISAYSLNLLVLEFLLGMLIAYLVNKEIIRKKIGFLLLLIGFVFLLLSINPSISELEIDRFFKWGLPSFLIVFGAVTTKQFFYPILRYLGDASYSIYLIQMFTIPVFYKIISRFEINNINADLLAILCLALCIVTGVLMHSFIEKPMTKILRRL